MGRKCTFTETYAAKSSYGFNYGITLSVWDYIFRAPIINQRRQHLPIGLPDEDKIPVKFCSSNCRSV
jgi:sterol desaturase/sphingolipid hydroxylase (fatty acid hydroxylase superfamily)